MPVKKKLTYSEALKELEEITYQIENEELDLDEVAVKIKRAKELFEYCYKRLREVKNDVQQIIDEDFQEET